MPNDKYVGAHQEYQIAGQRAKMVEHFGPSSYNATTGEVLDPRNFGIGGSFYAVKVITAGIDNSDGSFDYVVHSIKPLSGPNAGSWELRWYTPAGTQVSNGTNLSGFRVDLEIVGGGQ